jgi:hypothetical protein
MQDLPLLVELLDPLFQDEFDLLLGRELVIVEELGLKLVLDTPNSKLEAAKTYSSVTCR